MNYIPYIIIGISLLVFLGIFWPALVISGSTGDYTPTPEQIDVKTAQDAVIAETIATRLGFKPIWVCDECGKIYRTMKRAQLCEATDKDAG